MHKVAIAREFEVLVVATGGSRANSRPWASWCKHAASKFS